MKLSVIIPAYNCKSYIGNCLISVSRSINQSDTEVIIIDDCSTDETYDTIKKFINSNIFKNVILERNNENMGSGYTKNKGLELAKGADVGFIDADDFVDDNYYKKMLEIADKENADIVVSDIAIYSKNDINFDELYKNNFSENLIMKESKIKSEYVLCHWSAASACTKIFNKRILNKSYFKENTCDDLTFTYPALSSAESIYYCPKNYYYYRVNQNSLTRKVSNKKIMANFDSIFEALDILYKSKFHQVMQAIVVTNFLPVLYDVCVKLDVKDKKLIINHLKRLTKKYRFNLNEYLYNNPYVKKHDRILEPDFTNICTYILTYGFDGLLSM